MKFKKIHMRESTSALKRITGIVLSLLIVMSLFSVSLSVNATDETHIVTFHVNNTALNGNDTFVTKKTNSNGKIAYFSDTPQIDNYIFKGWYHDKNNDSQPVNFDNDVYSEDSDVYARWISVGSTSVDSQDNEVSGTTVGGFDMLGVQKRNEMYDENYSEIKPAGMRFIASLNNNILSSLDSLSDDTLTGSDGSANRVEYGFLLTKKSNIDNWISFAGNHISDYKMQYNGTDVNGVDTTVANTANYQGFITNVDCTASDYSTRQIRDHRKYSGYRLFTAVVTYSDNDGTDKQQDVSGRAYIRYVDANGHTKVYYDDYDGTNTYGGCSISYDNIPDDERDGHVYYSSLALCAGDVNNLNNDNADVAEDDLEHAVCAMKVDGQKCYVDLMQDTTITSQKIPFQNECDINLNGHTITEIGATNIQLRAATRLHDGEIYYNELAGNGISVSGASFDAKNIKFNGTIKGSCGLAIGNSAITKSNIQNCDVDVSMVSTNSNRFLILSNTTNLELNIENCNFDFEATSAARTCWAMSANKASSKKATIKNCDFNIKQSDDGIVLAAIYSKTDIDIINCSFVTEDNSTTASDLSSDYILYFSENTASIKNSSIISNENREDKTSSCVIINWNASLDIDNTTIVYNNNLDKTEGLTSMTALSISGDSDIIVHNNSSIKMNDYSCNNSNYGVMFFGSSKGTFDYCDINVSLGEGPSDGVYKGVGVGITESAVVTFKEDEGSVRVHGGNCGINNFGESTTNIYGGRFCSATHGGAYFGAKTNIYGGTFYNSLDAGEEPADLRETFSAATNDAIATYGGCYITGGADVTASNANFIGGNFGMRARANTAHETNNPHAVLTDCYVYGKEAPLSAWCGSITVAGSTVCVPELNADGTSIIDNRTP